MERNFKILSKRQSNKIIQVRYGMTNEIGAWEIRIFVLRSMQKKNLITTPTRQVSREVPVPGETWRGGSREGNTGYLTVDTVSVYHGWRKKGIIHGGRGPTYAALSLLQYFSAFATRVLQNTCVWGGEITGDNIYGVPEFCPVCYNDFDFIKEKK